MSEVLDHIAGPRLTTPRLTLRPPQRSDAAPFMAFLATERGRWVGHGPGGTAEARWRSAAALFGHWTLRGYGLFVVTEAGAPIGHVGPINPESWPEPEIAWAIWSPEHEGGGFAAEAATAARDHAFKDLGWSTVVSYLDPANVRSVALAERLGATRDATAERRHPDDMVYRHRAPEVPS